jgi:diaminopimelate epimerase
MFAFEKMEGLGNDFIFPDKNDALSIETIISHTKYLCDRRRGIGADGIIFVLPSAIADFRMRIVNSDGSEPEMCGNGIRCFARYIKEKKLSDKRILTVETGAGCIGVEYVDDSFIKVNMGRPILDAPLIPTKKASGRVVDEQILVDATLFRCTSVSMGNPHAVLYPEVIDDNIVLKYGPKIEKHPFFPNKVNVEFVKVLNDREVYMRVWERGCGETMACGTGACASVVSGILNKKHGNNVTVHLPGGDLSIEWSGNEHDPVFMTGPANFVFNGVIGVKK